MRSNRTVDVMREAAARGKEIENALKLREAGLITQEQAAGMLGLT